MLRIAQIAKRIIHGLKNKINRNSNYFDGFVSK